MTFDNSAGERKGAPNRPSGQTARSRETAEPWHTLAVADVARRLGTDVTRGLSATEVSRRYAEHGPNALADTVRRPRGIDSAGPDVSRNEPTADYCPKSVYTFRTPGR